MRILLAAMMLAFITAGLLFAGISLRDLFRKLDSRRRFVRAEGVVLHIQRKVMHSTNRHRFKPTILNFPVIRFSTQTGEAVTFTSQTGDSGKVSRYSAGARVPVRYDPLREFVPMIDTWSGIWLPTIMVLLAALGFLAGAALVGFMFSDQILGR
jgi:hypothetical protein